ncbi:MAG: UTP--glucose-1-phosphate uridylyltransferase [Armatimonadota bacterium]
MTNSRKITSVIIPAAGKGTRLLPLTKAIPKELIPLGRKPVLEHVVEECAECGIEEVLFVISNEKETIRRHFGDSAESVRFYYAYQPQPLGLADAIRLGRDFAGNSPFAVALGDSVIESRKQPPPFRLVIDTFEQSNASGVILVQPTSISEISRYGVVKPKNKTGKVFEIEDIVEKPSPKQAPSTLAVAGRYAFEPWIFDYIEQTPVGAGNEYQISDSIRLMLRDGRSIWCVALGEGEVRRDIGTFETYFEAFALELRREGFL